MTAIEKNGRGWIDVVTGNLIDRRHRCYEVIYADGSAVRVRSMRDAREIAGLATKEHALTWLALAKPVTP